MRTRITAITAIILLILLTLLNLNIRAKPFSKDVHENDLYTKIRYTQGSTQGAVLILSAIDGENSYGTDRDFGKFVRTLLTLKTRKLPLSLAFIVSSEAEFKGIAQYLEESLLPEQAVQQVTLVRAPFIDETGHFEGESRHDAAVQGERRCKIARLRNFLVIHALDREEYSIFVDSDIKHFRQASRMASTFIDSGLDIVVPRIIKGDDKDYDKNSWRGPRTKPSEEQLMLMDQKKVADYVPMDQEGMFHFSDYLAGEKEKDPAYSVPLDSVGGAVLFAKTIVYRQGVLFPTSYIVGTTWERNEGYDGIETEGLCYLARRVGYGCWGMPNQLGFHSDR